MPPAYLPPNLSLATINLPNTIQFEDLSHADLPSNWRQYPPPKTLADIGDAWANSVRSLALSVPTALIPQEFNTLINPMHPDMNHIKITSIEPYVFDTRLLS